MSDTAAHAEADRGELSKAYRPDEHEGAVWLRWLSGQAFHADPARVLRGEAPPYAILIPPPNVTGALHLGHALNNTIQDVLTRAHRMKGFEALWMPGTDHAGIATQTVVDRRLKESGQPDLAAHKRLEAAGENGREKFLAHVLAWKDDYEARITKQLQMLGCSCDWSRQRFTMDDICARAVREAFFRLFADGLIYRGKRLVNWDPVTQTALADDEVEMKEVQGHFYYLRYPLVHMSAPGDHRPVTWSELAAKQYPGADDHPEDDQAWITVATTRPETYLGDTAVAMNPGDPRARAVRGLHVELPLVGRVIPIIEDDYVVLPVRYGGTPGDPKAEYATGFLKVTPGHDPNDWEIGLRHKLAVINVMAPDASISAEHGWPDYDPRSGAHVFIGKSREEARQLVVREFQAHTINSQPLLEGIRDYVHSVGHSYRSHAAIEPYLSDQWYCRVTDDRLRGTAQRALRADQRTEASLAAWAESKPSGGTGVPPVSQHFQETAGTAVPPHASRPQERSGITKDLTRARRHLPHWQKGGSTYFVTFRVDHGELATAERQFVLDACFHFDGIRADVHLVTVMPDHVHVLMTPRERTEGEWWSLSELLHSIKGFTAHQINGLRGTTGSVWQDESFDRIVRDEDEFVEKHRYMMNNPAKAGLCARPEEYPFTRAGVKSQPQREDGDDRRDACPTGDGDSSLTFYPARYARNYETWHDNLRDWCISRQLWWGHRIPVWTATFDPSGETFAGAAKAGFAIGSLAHDLDAACDDGDAVLRVEGRDGPARVLDIINSIAGRRGPVTASVCLRREDSHLEGLLAQHGFSQDPDVLDTWFSSALWPLSTLGWPGADLPIVHPRQVDQGDVSDVRSVYVKRVGTWKSFIGAPREHSGGLIDTLLALRDAPKKTGGPRTMAYQLLSEADLRRDGDQAQPLLKPDDIQGCTDLVCAVAVKTDEPVKTAAGLQTLDAFLLSHGFQNTAGLLAAFNPTSVLCTAREIITLWVSRMVMFNRYFLAGSAGSQSAKAPNDKNAQRARSLESGHLEFGALASGPIPFRDVFIHAMIQDGEGRKMSKSLGNGVDPLDIIHSHGADAMRFTLVEMTTQTQDVRMPVEKDPATGRNTSPKFDLGRNFCNKLWNAARFAMGILGTDGGAGELQRQPLTLADRWMLTRLREGIAEIDAALSEYQFSAYAKAMYDLVRRDFCDWYLEAIKPTARDNPTQRAVLRVTLDALLRLLHPVVPFITEAIYERVGSLPLPAFAGITLEPPRRAGLLATAGWPAVDPALADAGAVATFERMRSLVETIRQLRSQQEVHPRRRITLHVQPGLAAEIAGMEGLVQALAGVATVTSAPATGASAVFTFEGVEHRASDLADALDASAERDRLEKQLGDLTKKLENYDKRLANPGYADKAPAHLVQQTREERDAVARDLDVVRARLKELA